MTVFYKLYYCVLLAKCFNFVRCFSALISGSYGAFKPNQSSSDFVLVFYLFRYKVSANKTKQLCSLAADKSVRLNSRSSVCFLEVTIYITQSHFENHLTRSGFFHDYPIY